MIKKVILAVIDEDTKKIVYKAAKNLFGEKQITLCESSKELYELVKYANDAAVIFDKYFFGYIISNRYERLKAINENLLKYFVEIGDGSNCFGMRVYKLGATGYIHGIENEETFENAMRRIQNGERIFPDDVSKAMSKIISAAEKRCINEVTNKEMSEAVYLSQGKIQKDICTLMNLKATTVSQHVHRVLKKIGYKKPEDFVLLNKRTYFYFDKDGGDFVYQD